MLFTAKIVRLGVSQETLKARVMFEADSKGVLPDLEELIDKTLSVEVNIFRKKRSKNANDFAWGMLDMLYKKLGISKDDLYFEALKSYGTSVEILLPQEVRPEQYFKYFEVIEELPYEKVVRVYKGSSEFDTVEMSKFIDGLKQECAEQEIYIDEANIRSLLDEWENTYEKHNSR